MGRGDSRLSLKMRRRRAQSSLKSRIERRRVAAKAERVAAKPAPAPAAPAATKAGREKK